EMLVQGHQADYFDYFYQAISAHPERITPEQRAAHAAAYATDEQLTAGFEWYRAVTQDAEDNRAGDPSTATLLLYRRGDHGPGEIATYVKSFGEAGVRSVRHATIPASGHFAPEESPEAVWREISRFMSETTPPR